MSTDAIFDRSLHDDTEISTPAARFKYSPLSSEDIRLVQIDHYNQELGIIECTMTHEDLMTSKFRALSYTWGDPTDNKLILVDGKSLKVTANLEGFLRMFTSGYQEESKSKLWIDAICIDQENKAERSLQVLRMPSIYKSAKEVIVWLGEETEKADTGFSKLLSFFVQFAESDDPMADSGLRAGFESLMAMSEGCEMRAILQAPWWRRLWILQEYALAKEVKFLCGLKTMRLDLLHRIFDLIVNASIMYGDLDAFLKWIRIKTILDLRDTEGQPGNQAKKLFSLMIQFTESRCLDPRDRIYSLLGICSDIKLGDIVPNYQRPVQDVYMDAVRAHLLKNDNLDILTGRFPSISAYTSLVPDTYAEGSRPLSDAQHFPLMSEYESSWPGWLPYYGTKLAFSLKLRRTEQFGRYNASRYFSLSNDSWSLDPSAGSLTVSGAVIDVITRIAPNQLDEIKGLTHTDISLHRLRGYKRLLEDLPPVYELTGESIKNAWELTILAPNLRGRSDISMAEISGEVINPNAPPCYDPDLIDDTITVNFIWKLAVTSSGLICCVPSTSEVGDSVVFLVGGSVLYAVRPLPHSQDTSETSQPKKAFKFIGDVYVHGLMDGEVAGWGLDFEPIVLF
ncbi:hypothetical protein CcaCcLH18_09335 [Colletotrichum camelliae]|nr:hypothetical protein CcaCcLH18_09335 [Colletotrichum camelliae]